MKIYPPAAVAGLLVIGGGLSLVIAQNAGGPPQVNGLKFACGARDAEDATLIAGTHWN